MAEDQLFSEDQAQEILHLAVSQPAERPMSRDELVRMGAEIGLSPQQIEAAIAQQADLQRQRQDQQQLESLKARYRESRWHAVASSASGWAGMAVLMSFIWFASGSHGGFWPVWVMFGTGWSLPSKLFRAARPFNAEDPEFRSWCVKQAEKEVDHTLILRRLSETAEPGDKIALIKGLREETGLGLSESREIVRKYLRESSSSSRE